MPEPVETAYGYEKGVMYGEHERHRLDVYWPRSGRQNGGLPVVIYFHGGGFWSGDNEISPHIHANIGKFFASNNMIGILGTYRVLPQAQFPHGLEDITSAIHWIKTNVHRFGGDKRNIFAIGQSAGGAHLAMALFSGRLQQQDAMPQGVMLQSAALFYDLTQEQRRRKIMDYYTTEDPQRILAQSALGIFVDSVTAETIMPKLFIIIGEFDFEECVQGHLKFLGVFFAKMGRLPTFEVLSDHNHVSYCLSIGLPGDEVGPRIVDLEEPDLLADDSLHEAEMPRDLESHDMSSTVCLSRHVAARIMGRDKGCKGGLPF
ncbi:hypothetical protein BBP40_004079 [Aspergillus hancockii]|nr:hypothetical protein BBP40_004079 [Aspergillus hancockii]